MKPTAPETLIRKTVDACADCDDCRYMMDTSCFFLPELFRLHDREKETGERITPAELKHLTDLCNFCGLCPCANIRADIMKAKTAFIDRDGLKPGVRAMEDVKQVGKLCGVYPRLTNLLLQNQYVGGFLKKSAGVHPERKLPVFPEKSFPSRLQSHPIPEESRDKGQRKVAYFAGCTGQYLFPDVPEAAVEVFRHNGIEIHVPEQECCGMPPLLEGDRKLALKFARSNIDHLAGIVENGYDIVCSCPTCGYMLKNILKEGAYYSDAYQASVGADAEYMKIPVDSGGRETADREFKLLKRSTYRDLLKDDGYFSSLDPLRRVAVAEHTYDLGEYLGRLHQASQLKTEFGPVDKRVVYYPPCHLREQNVGMPYPDLLALIPGLDLTSVRSSFFCCGISGIMGFKKEFHQTSLQMGNRLMEKIGEMAPEILLTDCLSCRIQFNQMTDYRVIHPIELLKDAYDRAMEPKATEE
jgi:glycerol-3-phosphate dehydrogenase subunit C